MSRIKRCDSCGKDLSPPVGMVEIRLDFLYSNFLEINKNEESLVTWKYDIDICEDCYEEFIRNFVKCLKIIPDKWVKYKKMLKEE